MDERAEDLDEKQMDEEAQKLDEKHIDAGT